MNWIDWLLVVMVVMYAVSGYWQGFITGTFATVGLVLGGWLGIWFAPKILHDADGSVGISLMALFVVILAASLGQVSLQWVGARVRGKLSWRPAKFIDAATGAVLSAVAVLLVAWALGVAISGARIDGLSAKVRDSVVLGAVNSVLPDSTVQVLDGFNNVVGTSVFPRYLEPFAPERIVDVGPGPERLRTDPDVVAAGQSVLKIYGENKCGTSLEGTGWVFDSGYMVTNAHVVAGVQAPRVQMGQDQVSATVVAYDPQIDLALLAVDTGDLTPLKLAAPAAAGDGAAILGYPNDGPFDLQPARIRSEQKLRSPDIYGSGTAIREVYALRGLIRPGNSGGPVVDSAGEVLGVVFAASITDRDTGYALTAQQVSDVIDPVAQATEPVDTGNCL